MSVAMIRYWRSYYRAPWMEGVAEVDRTREWTGQSMSSLLRVVEDRRRWVAITAEASVLVPQRRLGVTGFDRFIHSFIHCWHEAILQWTVKCQIGSVCMIFSRNLLNSIVGDCYPRRTLRSTNALIAPSYSDLMSLVNCRWYLISWLTKCCHA